MLDFDIHLAHLEFRRVSRQAEQAGGDEYGTENEFTHGDSLGFERLTDSVRLQQIIFTRQRFSPRFNILTIIVAAQKTKKAFRFET